MDRPALAALPVMSAYVKYYKRFEMTYHVLLQVESIAWKGRNLPDVSPLVDANFTAEVETLVLTAGHDAERLQGPLRIDVARPGEQMTGMNGKTCLLRAGDMLMRDGLGVCCSILHGQDDRSPIGCTSRHVLYVAYAPPGVPAEAVEGHLRQVEANLRLAAPGLQVDQCRMLAADGNST
jgi:DNA/RNA-binding domain of Phe-tRNA-synthetase-like protein